VNVAHQLRETAEKPGNYRLSRIVCCSLAFYTRTDIREHNHCARKVFVSHVRARFAPLKFFCKRNATYPKSILLCSEGNA
jgi:hypothetical protein